MKNSVLKENQNPFEYKKLLGELVVTNYIKSDTLEAEEQFKMSQLIKMYQMKYLNIIDDIEILHYLRFLLI